MLGAGRALSARWAPVMGASRSSPGRPQAPPERTHTPPWPDHPTSNHASASAPSPLADGPFGRGIEQAVVVVMGIDVSRRRNGRLAASQRRQLKRSGTGLRSVGVHRGIRPPVGQGSRFLPRIRALGLLPVCTHFGSVPRGMAAWPRKSPPAWRRLRHAAWSPTMSRTILTRDSKRPGLDLNHTAGGDWHDRGAKPVRDRH